MKARIREVELEDATATDIATVLGQIITQRTPQLEQRSPGVVEEHEAEAVEVIDEPEAAPAFGVTRADRVVPDEDMDRSERITANLMGALEDVAGEEIPSNGIVYPEAPHWAEIPVEVRWWGHGMRTLHIRNPEDAERAMCNRDKKTIGANPRSNDVPAAESIAHVCGSCWRRQVEAQRP